MQALRHGLARATTKTTITKTTTTLAPPRHSRAPAVRAMASSDTPLDKSTPEAVWRGILTPEAVS